MSWVKQKQAGFTIVELLIVIVVIAILAVVTIVAYNGIQNRAKQSSAQSAASQVAKKLMAYGVQNADQFPTALSDISVSDGDGALYNYYVNNTTNPRTFCVAAVTSTYSYYVSSTVPTPTAGGCPGNLVAWTEPETATMSVPTATVDTTVYRTEPASLRIGPNMTNRLLRGAPHSGSVGERFVVSMWLKTDPSWDGTSSNSKIRFGTTGGALLADCGYGGVKVNWTYVTCTYTLTVANTSVNISVGNNGTVGDIWIDDLSLLKQ